MTMRGLVAGLLALTMCVSSAACRGSEPGVSSAKMTLYTCVSDSTIQPVIKEFEAKYPGHKVDLFRAPTGELNARVAGDARSGGLKADVIWACDPLTMQNYLDQKLVGGWTPQSDIPARVRTNDYVGVAILYLVAVTRKGSPQPAAWADLTRKDYSGAVAVPDPGTAASALGALGYFAQNPDYGIAFYAALKKNGAVQVSTPDNVTTGVAQGVYRAGITVASSAYPAQQKGSPINIVWPAPGAIAIYGPIALATHAQSSTTAKDFISYVTSEEGQTLIGASGSYPALPGLPGPSMPAGAPVVFPDWSALGSQKKALLEDYQKIFGGS
jgi:iron(III) transport system substrate-binding protein